MTTPRLWTALALAGSLAAAAAGCSSMMPVAGWGGQPYEKHVAGQCLAPPGGISKPLPVPELSPLPHLPNQLPSPPEASASGARDAAPKAKEEATLPPPKPLTSAIGADAAKAQGVLELAEVLASVERAFPLLLAAEQERAIASGRRLTAEGAFDLGLRARGVNQDGTFPSNRLDLLAEQPTMLHGVSVFGGYRFGFGDFPVYYGDRLTADGGEFRAGVLLPLLRDGGIDRRRAALRQAQLGEGLAEPVVQRARIDYLRTATHRYWNWVAAGQQYSIADQLLQIARERQNGLEVQFKKGQIAEFVVIDNRRLIAEREGLLIAAQRRLQQASFDLSLYLRDAECNPILPCADRLPRGFTQQQVLPVDTTKLCHDVETAFRLRPELNRFHFLKEQASVELRLAENQSCPALNAAVAGAQDVGAGKKSEGIFALDRSLVEASLVLEVPLQRRDAQGRARAANGTLMQLLAQERFARDQITVDVQDAYSSLDRTYARLERAREERQIAQRVSELELERFRKGQSTLLEVNLRELAAAGAEIKVVDALAEFFRAMADYRAAVGLDACPPGSPPP